ncbi:hypothetical protein ACH34C_07055 [Elizabethkingia anophelis]|uniref:hypothetical protein n=1 Tax=Elizabethkingia anophelis TaxID=1117645 RepID=UPI0037870A8D
MSNKKYRIVKIDNLYHVQQWKGIFRKKWVDIEPYAFLEHAEVHIAKELGIHVPKFEIIKEY